MKISILSIMLLTSMSSFHAMEIFDSWNAPSSKSSLTDEDETEERSPSLRLPNSRRMLISSILADNDTGVVLALIDYPDLNVPGKKYGRDDPPLCVAAGHGGRTVLEALLVNGAQVDVYDGNGDSPAHYAARFGRLTALQVLVENGASLEATNMWGQTVLHQALEETPLNIDLVEWLLEMRANVNAQDEEGKSAVHYACMHDRKDLLELLRQCDDARWDLEDEDEMPPYDMPLLDYYNRPPSPPPLPPSSPGPCTTSYHNLDELLGYFFTESNNVNEHVEYTDQRNRTIHTYYCLPQLEKDDTQADADDECNSSNGTFETARDKLESPPVLLIRVTSQDTDEAEYVSWDSDSQ